MGAVLGTPVGMHARGRPAFILSKRMGMGAPLCAVKPEETGRFYAEMK